MATDFEKLHSMFYGNMNEAMYQWLAHQLGVSAEALRAIQIGYIPTVKFGGGKLGGDYFSTPMRDSDGKVIGLSLRALNGSKCVWPGSGLGVMFVLNPKHRKGDQCYSSGAHNWVQIAKEKELCPICGKPDWCLVSSENTSDPKAVICTRTQSDRRLRNGWLHIRKPEGIISSEALIGGEGPVLSVEGMSDVAAAFDLGLTAVGRPNDRGGQVETAALVRGRELVIMGENDRKADGKWPGREGMVAMYTFVKGKTFSTKMLMPPVTVKDLRGWLTNGLTRAEFDVYLAANAIETVEGLVLDNNEPMTVAKAFLKDEHHDGTRYMVRRWGKSWYEYDVAHGRYAVLEDDEALMREVYKWAEGKQFVQQSEKGAKTVNLAFNTTGWANFQQAGASESYIPGITTLPAWINGAKGPNVKDLILFSNGTLNVQAFLEGKDEKHYMVAPTPDLFNITALPIAFDPSAECPAWLGFLVSALGDEPGKIDLLQEWMGYCLTLDTSMQKMMYFVGKPGAGKGTVIRVMQALAGKGQHSSTSLTQLAEQFGLAPLIGKMICVIADAREAKHDALRGFEVLLGITGDDAVQINRKFKDQLAGELITARITMASNHFLALPDPDGALPRRLNVIRFSHPPLEPDFSLRDRLNEELEGIAVWALSGLKRLRDRGRFSLPPSSAEAVADWSRISNPIAAFIEDCIQVREHVITDKDQLYDCWSGWTKDTHRAAGTRSVFLRQFADFYPVVDVGAGFKGIDVVQSAARRYLGRP